MRSVVETDVGLVVPAVNALPGNVLPAVEVCGDLLDGRLVRRDGFVTGHAPRHTRDCGARAPRCGHVAIQAFHLRFLDVRFVIVGDGLYGFGTQSEEMLYGERDGGMSRGENASGSNRRIFGNSLPAQDTALKKKPRKNTSNPQGDQQRDRSAVRMPAVSDFVHTATDNLMVPSNVCNHFLGVIPSPYDTRPSDNCGTSHAGARISHSVSRGSARAGARGTRTAIRHFEDSRSE